MGEMDRISGDQLARILKQQPLADGAAKANTVLAWIVVFDRRNQRWETNGACLLDFPLCHSTPLRETISL